MLLFLRSITVNQGKGMTNYAKVNKVEYFTFHNGKNDYFNDCVKNNCIIVMFYGNNKTKTAAVSRLRFWAALHLNIDGYFSL